MQYVTIHADGKYEIRRDLEDGELPMSNCDIPGKCGFCGEHVFCVNSRHSRENWGFWRRFIFLILNV